MKALGRTLSITDDELGASATAHVREVDGKRKIVELTFTADDGDLTAEVTIALLEGLGIALPARALAATPAAPSPRANWNPPPAKRAAVKKAPAKKVAASKTEAPAQRRPYRTGGPPTPEQLQAAFRLHEGDLPAMADQFKAGVSTVSNWLRKAREGGTVINLNGAEPATADA